jgi:hypothetical protein
MNKKLNYVDYTCQEGLVFKVIETELGQSEHGMEYVFNSYPDEIFSVCVHNIKFGLEKKLDVVPILIFEDIDFLVELEKMDFEECLENALSYFVHVENYEMCGITSDIKNSLQFID